MAGSIKGISVLNTVKWADDVKSRKRMFNNIRRYKKAVSSIRMNLGGLSESREGLRELGSIQKMMDTAHEAALKEIAAKQKMIDTAHSAALTQQNFKQKVIDTAHSSAISEAAAKQRVIDAAHGAALSENETRQRTIDRAHNAALAEKATRQRNIDTAHGAALAEQASRQRRIDSAHGSALSENASRQQRMDNAHSAALAEHASRQAAANRRSQGLSDRVSVFEQTNAMQRLRETNRLEYDRRVTQLRQITSERELRLEIARQRAELRNINNHERARLRLLNRSNFAQQRLTGSMRQMAGAAFSVFTAIQGVAAVARTGMGIQRVKSSMLAVSDNSADAKENIAFVRAETLRLGGDLVQNSKALSQLLANRGGITKEDTKALFTGIAELSTARGLTTDEVAGAVKAIGQMMGKFSCSSDLKRGKPTWSVQTYVQTSYGNLPC